MISSAAGFGWEQNLRAGSTSTSTSPTSTRPPPGPWTTARPTTSGASSPINAYVAREAIELLKKGIRINAILPGPTNTPLAQANAELWLSFGADYREELGHRGVHAARAGLPAGVPLQRRGGRASPASTLVTDAGYFASGMAGSFEPASGAVEFMRSVF